MPRGGGVVSSEEKVHGGFHFMRMLTAWLLGVIALGLLGLAACTGWLRPHEAAWAEGVARAAALIIAISLSYAVLRVVTRGRKAAPGQPESIYEPDIDWLAHLQGKVTKSRFQHDSAALISFIELVTNPADYRSRVAETIDLDGRSIKKRVWVEFVLPSNVVESDSLYLPVLQPVTGDLLDNFRLADGSDGSITNLSYTETIELAAIGLRVLLLHATKKPYKQWKKTRTAELIFLELIARRAPSTPESVKSSIEKGLKLIEGNDNEDTKDFIEAYLKSLSAGYPIVAAVPHDLIVSNRVLLQYERTVIPTSRSIGTEGKFRLGLGIQPSQITVPVDLAMTAGSYHLQINGPPEKYIARQILKCANCNQRLQRNGQNKDVKCTHPSNHDDPEDTHFHLRGRFGQSFTHLYMRGYAQQTSESRRYEMLVRFNETPPGSRASAAVTALAALTFIWLIGRLYSNHETVTNSDLPAILLALPAIAASWFGLASGSEALVGSSLHARLSLIMSGLLSIGSVMVYLLQNAAIASASASSTHSAHRWPLEFTIAGVHNLPWDVLLLLSSVNFLYSMWHFAARIRDYLRLLRKTDPLTENHSVW